MAKEPTKKELMEKIAELTKIMAANGIVVTEKGDPSLMDHIKECENKALHDVIDIMEACENKTGREHPQVSFHDDGNVVVRVQALAVHPLVDFQWENPMVDQEAVKDVANYPTLRAMLGVVAQHAVDHGKFTGDHKSFAAWCHDVLSSAYRGRYEYRDRYEQRLRT